MTLSGFYAGTIRHRRLEPHREFRHPLALAYLDLDELETLLDGRLLRRGLGALRFRRDDYLGPKDVSLDAAVRGRVQELCGERPTGPIRLLTGLRTFGVCFNPVSFYYCFDDDRRTLRSVLAEVTNTPWGERYSYLLDERGETPALVRGEFSKQLHVSPFMGMDHVYRARATAPGQTLSVHIESHRDGRSVFDATLSMTRRSFSPASARATSRRFPLETARVLALIYGHALGLKLAGVRYFPHPRTVTH